MNVLLRGVTKNILDRMVEEGYANTQSEAIRLAINWFGKEYLSAEEQINAKLDKIDADVDKGKIKLLSEYEALGEYAKYAK